MSRCYDRIPMHFLRFRLKHLPHVHVGKSHSDACCWVQLLMKEHYRCFLVLIYPQHPINLTIKGTKIIRLNANISRKLELELRSILTENSIVLNK